MANFNGDDAPNIFTGGSDADTAYGNGGNDSLSGNGGNDTLNGGAGADTLDGGTEDDILISFAVSNLYYAYYESVSLDTGTEHDVLIGGAGDDLLFAGYGDDVSGGTGYNKLYINFLGATSGVYADFRAQQMGGSITVGGGTISGITQTMNIQGSNYDDTIYSVGSYYGFSTLNGNGGNDLLVGDYYTRYMNGDDGNDTVDGRSSQYLNAVYGGAGDDILYTPTNGSAAAYGGDGNDTLYSHSTTYGGAGNDTIVLQATYYAGGVYGEAGDDDITAAAFYGNVIAGGSGADVLRGNSGDDKLVSADFVPNTYFVPAWDMGLERDILTGGGGTDTLAIGYGDDADGGAGSDTLWLSLGGLAAGAVLDTAGIVSGQPFVLGGGTIQNIETLAYLRGSDFDDQLTIATQASLLTIDAGDGNNRIVSNASSVALSGGNGNDRFYSGIAGDTFDGGAGFDTVYYSSALAGVTMTLAEPGQTGTGAGGDSLTNVEAVEGSDFADSLTGNSIANTLAGGAGDDLVHGGGGNDLIFSGAGTDQLFGDAGNDVILFGASMASTDFVDGGAGLDQLALQGHYVGGSALLFGGGVVSIENIAILPGDDTRFGDPGTNFYDYSLTLQDATVASGVQLVVDANRLRAGEDFTFDGSAELDGSFFIYGGGGTDILFGGASNDVFLFGAWGQWNPADVVIGGAGIDQLALRGNYSLTFGAGQLVGIENIGLLSAHDTRFGALGSSYSYDLTMVDENVAAGVQMIVDGAKLRIAEFFRFDGSAELDGSFRVFGGLVDDTIIASRNNDFLQGNGGIDTLTGGLGADVFRYLAASDSAPGAEDKILDFAPGADKIDLSRIDANSHTAGDQAFHWIGDSVFTGTGAASAGELRAYQSGQSWFVEGDTDGNGVADFRIDLTLVGPTPLGAGDFVL